VLLVTVVRVVAFLSSCGGSAPHDLLATAAAIEVDRTGPASTPRSQTERLGEWAEKDEVAMVAWAVEDPAKANPEGYQPSPGSRLVAVEFEMGCLAGSHQFGPQLLKLVDTRGKSYDRVPRAMADREDVPVTMLHAGDRMRGWLAYEVPDGAEPASLVYGFSGYIEATLLEVGLRE